jgi:hypothetical protein
MWKSSKGFERKEWAFSNAYVVRLVLLAEKVDDDACLPSKNSEVFMPVALLSNKYILLHCSPELYHRSHLRTNTRSSITTVVLHLVDPL